MNAKSKPDPLAHISPALRPLAVATKSLSPDPENVRQHPKRNIDAIKASLLKFGQQAPVVFIRQGPGGKRLIVKKGNGLLAAARALRWKHLAAVESDLAGDAAKAFAIADNRTSDLSEFDTALLAEQLKELQESDVDLASMGFTAEELAELDKPPEDQDEDDERKRVEFNARKRKKLSELFAVVVECRNERDQLAFYRKMQREGRRCRLQVL